MTYEAKSGNKSTSCLQAKNLNLHHNLGQTILPLQGGMGLFYLTTMSQYPMCSVIIDRKVKWAFVVSPSSSLVSGIIRYDQRLSGPACTNLSDSDGIQQF